MARWRRAALIGLGVVGTLAALIAYHEHQLQQVQAGEWTMLLRAYRAGPAGRPGATAAPGVPASCRVRSLVQLPVVSGPGQALRPHSTMLTYTRTDRAGVYQLYYYDLARHTDTCLTCRRAGPPAPPADLNEGSPSYDRTGRWMALVVQQPSGRGKSFSTPGSGWYQDVWLWDRRTGAWSNLTHYPNSGVHGALIPRLSPNGRRIAWAELYGQDVWLDLASYVLHLPLLQTGLWGYWRIKVADLVTTVHGGAHLTHVRTFYPGSDPRTNRNFYETQEWSPDGAHLLFASDVGTRAPWLLNLSLLDPATGRAVPLTADAAQWNELATFAPDGRLVVSMSTRCCVAFQPDDVLSLETAEYLGPPANLYAAQLTHFNTPGFAEYAGQLRRVVTDKPEFSPDGRQLIFGTQIITPTPHPRLGQSRWTLAPGNFWRITFAGACGAGRAAPAG